MSGSGLLLDTNAIIHFVAGTMPELAVERMKGQAFHVSFITQIEVRSFRNLLPFRDKASKEFLPMCTIHGLSEALKDEAVGLRLRFGLKTPDAIIAATAKLKGLPLVTGDKGLRRLTEELELIFVKYP